MNGTRASPGGHTSTVMFRLHWEPRLESCELHRAAGSPLSSALAFASSSMLSPWPMARCLAGAAEVEVELGMEELIMEVERSLCFLIRSRPMTRRASL